MRDTEEADVRLEPMTSKIENSLSMAHLLSQVKPAQSINVIIGCVDNVDARLCIAEGLLEEAQQSTNNPPATLIYVDSGNMTHSGQIYVIDYLRDKKVNKVPTTHKQFVEVFNSDEIRALDNVARNCTLEGEQSILMNFRCASYLYAVVQEIFASGSVVDGSFQTDIRHLAFTRYTCNLIQGDQGHLFTKGML
jgi:hypothetical protein